MNKLKHDVERHDIDCYFSETVEKECEYKISSTVKFLDDVLRKVIVAYLEGIILTPRDLSKTRASNEDLHTVQDAFLTVKRNIRDFDVLSDPFQAIEEWVVEKLEEEVEKTAPVLLGDFVRSLTATILEAITNLNSNLESITQLETGFVTKSYEAPNQTIVNILVNNGISYDDAIHVSVISNHQNRNVQKAVFLTFDYRTILLDWERIQNESAQIMTIDCCDPIYGLSYLR